MSRHSSDTNANDDAEWLAIRYVLDELTSGEAAAFERRLGVEQSARDALVQATRLVSTVAATNSVRTAAAGRRGRRPRTIAALAATAATLLVGVVALQNRFADPQNVGVPVVTDDVDPARLAVLWSQSAETLNGVPESLDEVSAVETDVDPSDVFLPPDWMLAAVEQEPWPAPLDGEAEGIERN
ncbi:MAG: hypothetical protein WBC44_12475 [Planctomycetaceae bacterium]